MGAKLTRNPSSARAIEQIVRAELLLLALLLCLAAALLVQRGDWLAWIGIGAVSASLTLLTRAFTGASKRELLQVAQHGLLVGCVLVLLAIGLGPTLGLYRTLTVLSGSMRPTFNPGDVIVVRPVPLRSVRAGEVISFNLPNGAHELETHRVVRVLSGGDSPVVQTKGDANNSRDPWTAKLHGQQGWRLALVIPKAGFLVNVLRSQKAHLAAIFVAPILLALLALAEIWGIAPRLRPGRRRLVAEPSLQRQP